MLAATGMLYREHPAQEMADHTGAGVYYGALPVRRRLAPVGACASSAAETRPGKGLFVALRERSGYCSAPGAATPCRSTS
jgi:hypothetical protein